MGKFNMDEFKDKIAEMNEPEEEIEKKEEAKDPEAKSIATKNKKSSSKIKSQWESQEKDTHTKEKTGVYKNSDEQNEILNEIVSRVDTTKIPDKTERLTVRKQFIISESANEYLKRKVEDGSFKSANSAINALIRECMEKDS